MQNYIVSLSSIPPRFPELARSLDSLLAQSVPPERVILYLSQNYARFPDWDGQLPEVPKGVEIRIVDEDYGPATKLLPALREFAGQDIDILFCDDDQIYQPYLAEDLLKGRADHPDACIAASGMQDYPPLDPNQRRVFSHRPRMKHLWKKTNIRFLLHLFGLYLLGKVTGKTYPEPLRRKVLRAGYADGFEGWMGVLVRPGFFSEEVFDIPDFARPVDDVWLSGQATRMGHPPWVVGGLFERPLMPLSTENHDNETALHRSVFAGVHRSQSNIDTARYFQKTFGIWG
ncbi:hypothetical protein [uncultured Shimia sp.]|uniref:glycosyltransferase family A protein n=1 Tax=uncultured Shimia sp. TaxID=573152 RepID=UPI00260FE82B|nr:hypothetical protein [uncultured Shimia sp.]